MFKVDIVQNEIEIEFEEYFKIKTLVSKSFIRQMVDDLAPFVKNLYAFKRFLLQFLFGSILQKI